MSSTDPSSAELNRLAAELCDVIRQAFGASLTSTGVKTLVAEFRRMKSLYDDIGQQVFLECSSEHEAGREIDDELFQRTVWRICKRAVREAHRHAQADRVVLEETVATNPEPDQLPIYGEAMKALSPEDFCLVELRVFQQLPAKDAAEQMGLSLSTFYRRWNAISQQLRLDLKRMVELD